MTRLRLMVLFGGASSEHEISVRSARSVCDALDRERFDPILVGIGRDRLVRTGPPGQALDEIVSHGALVGDLRELAPDVVFPLLHGPGCEDGSIAGWLESLGLAYVGSGVLASSTCMDKAVQKHLLGALCPDIPLVAWRQIDGLAIAGDQPRAASVADLVAALGLPCFVKPANLGSSVGVIKATTTGELDRALIEAAHYDRKLVVERGVNAREIEIAVLGDGGSQTVVSCAGEIVLPPGLWYDYDTKYITDVATLQIPADLPARTATAIAETAQRAFTAMGCRGLARIDFLLDRESDTAYLNELNTMPGFTSISMYPKLLAHSGIAYTDLISRLCDLGLQAHAERTALRIVR